MTKPTPPEKFEGELPSSIPLTAFSTESLEALDHFGIDAPGRLNAYAMAIEDKLIEALKTIKSLRDEVSRLQKLLKENNISYDKSNESDSSS